MRRKTHILVIDGEGIARDGLCALLQQDEALHLDATFSSARAALRARGDLRPQVVIMDFALAMKSGPQTIAHVKKRWPEATVLVLSVSGEGQAIEAARRAGADGYVLRNDQRAELFNALHALAERRHYISRTVLEPPSGSARVTPRTRRTESAGLLTAREQEVVTLIAEGYRTREMAQLLSLSHKTVERHRTNLMRKLGVRSATGVVAFAITHGYVGF
ncbi:MAG: response regulator transcription factor [Proteobacteria bacterium]|nr:response regulator transcription factor [Pseudomonadota bacterium]